VISFCLISIRRQLVSKGTIMKNFALGWAKEVGRGWQESAGLSVLGWSEGK
jgi:hypothetical protein